MGHRWVVRLEEVPAGGREEFGGKAVPLAELRRAGYAVPEGLVVGAGAYACFERARPIRRALRAARAQEGYPSASVEVYWDLVRLRIRQAPLPSELVRHLREAMADLWPGGMPALAVRSSGATEDSSTASFAGIYRSVLGVTGEEELWEAIRACWASLWTPRAVEYRRHTGPESGPPRMALIVQRMLAPEVAGVAFSTNPITGEREVVINAVTGLAEGLVSGWVEPERHVVPRRGPEESRRTEDGGRQTADGRRQTEVSTPEGVLEPGGVAELAAHVVAIERQFGSAQDVEWARQEGEWWFMQARPLTARRNEGGAARGTPPDLPWGENLWSNGNVAEVLAGVVTPMTASVVVSGLSPAFLSNFRRMGYTARRDLPLLRQFAGRCYLNLAALQWISWQGWGWTAAETNRTIGGHQPEIPLPDRREAPWATRGGWAWRTLRAGGVALLALRRAPGEFRRAAGRLAKLARLPLPEMGELELMDCLYEQAAILDGFFPSFLTSSSAATGFFRPIPSLLDRWLPGGAAAGLQGLLAGLGSITSAEHGYALRRLAGVARQEPAAGQYLRQLAEDAYRTAADWRGALAGTETMAGLERFLEQYGHRAVAEWELASPRWSEDPGYLLRLVGGFLDTPLPDGPDGTAHADAREALFRRVRQRSPLLGPLRAAVLRSFSRRYGQAVALREEGKSLGVRITAMSRAVCLEVAGRLIRRGTLDHLEQIFFLERGEMAGLLLGEIRPESLRDLVDRRREQAARWEAEEPPPVICGDELRRADDGEERPAPDEGVLTAGCRLWRGLSVSAGRAAGRARVLLSPVEGYRLQPGEVLVAPSTDPAWTPIFLRASALVLEIGGLLSHGAIVAREYGLPAVANLPEVTREIPDGAWVEVDGNRGEVRVGREGP